MNRPEYGDLRMNITKTLYLLRILTVALIAAISVSMMTLAVAARPEKDWQPLPEGEISRIAFGSGAFQWGEQPIWNAAANAGLDLFIFNGDAIYADFDGENVYDVTEETLRKEWARLAAIPTFQRFRKKVPIMATWDNHDYGKYDGGAEFPLKEISQQIFLDFFGEPADSERRKTPGIYDAKSFGPEGRRVQIILLDNRYFKGPYIRDKRSKKERKALGLSGSMGKYLPNTDPDVTLLGEAQWHWLEAQLKKPAEIRLLVSGTQIIPDEKGMEEWGNFPLERKRLFHLIRTTHANGVILLTGNVHFAEVSMISNGVYPLYDFTASGLDHTNENYAKAKNSYRAAGPYYQHNFGLVEIDWEAEPSPLVLLKVIGVDGSTAFEHQITLASLRPSQTSETSTGVETLIPCPEPRPQVCTREYRPVCATFKDGSFKTYSNGCTACTDPAVTGYREGTCE
jgi:alkaline phosphatase D